MPDRIKNLKKEGTFIVDLMENSDSSELLGLSSKFGSTEDKNDVISEFARAISSPVAVD